MTFLGLASICAVFLFKLIIIMIIINAYLDESKLKIRTNNLLVRRTASGLALYS